MDRLGRARALLEQLSLTSAAAATARAPDQSGRTEAQRLCSVVLSRDRLWRVSRRSGRSFARSIRETAARVEIDARYAVYLDRQSADIECYRRDEQLALPSTLDYGAIGGLSAELCAKLSCLRPRTLGQAQRIEGVTPAALTLLAARARRG